MSCCSALGSPHLPADPGRAGRIEELRAALAPGRPATLVLALPGMAAGMGAGLAARERTLAALPGVARVRANLTTRRLSLEIDDAEAALPAVLDALERAGEPVLPVDGDALEELRRGRRGRELALAAGVAGFAMMNIMLLSVSVWSGADAATRDLFALVSALIAAPAVAYSGRIFFRPALAVLRQGRTSMDVPISLGVLVSFALSLDAALRGAGEVWFEASTGLLFFLLIGRLLDEAMREKARSAAAGLARLEPRGGQELCEDGTLRWRPLDEIAPGMRLLVPAGGRVPVDARVAGEAAAFDRSLVTGESRPVRLEPGTLVESGALALGGPATLVAERAAPDSFMAQVSALVRAAEEGRGRLAGFADRLARLYTPVVHALAAFGFVLWWALTGDIRHALEVAVAVLIVTCPCALGLAVPLVHVAAATRLFRAGILMKDGAALERLAGVTRVAFDKTGTLTLPQARASRLGASSGEDGVAAALAARSTHPAARAVLALLTAEGVAPAGGLTGLREIPGEGIEAWRGGARVRLGRPAWALEGAPPGGDDGGGLVAFAASDGAAALFALEETLRPRAAASVAALGEAGLTVALLSGDAPAPVARVARALAMDEAAAGLRPEGKIARLTRWQAAGESVLMVGDGLNDAPALAAAAASMAPADACEAGRCAADLVWTRPGLEAVPLALAVARRADALVRRNVALALGYNALAVPLALAGGLTPLLAALAMSTSSLLVTANSLLMLRFEPTGGDAAGAPEGTPEGAPECTPESAPESAKAAGHPPAPLSATPVPARAA